MRSVLKFAAYAIAAMVGLLLLTLVVLQFVGDATYKGWLTSAVNSTTGRELAIAGDFSLDLGTTLRIEATDVSLANAEWGTRATMFEAKRIHGELKLWPLFSGVVDFVLRADDSELALETNDTGRGNWELGASERAENAQPKSPDDAPRLRIVPRDLRITHSRVSFIQADAGRLHTLELNNLQLGIIEGHISTVLDAQFEGRAVRLSAELGSMELGQGTTTQARIDGRFGDIELTGSGTVAELGHSAGPRLDLALQVEAPNTRALDPFIRVALPELGSIQVSTQIKGSAGVYTAADLHAQLSGDATAATVKGRIEDLIAVDGVDLDAEVRTDTLPEIIDALGLDLPVQSPRSVEARAVLRGNRTSLAIHDGRLVARDQDVEAVLTGSGQNVLQHDGINSHLELNAASLEALAKFVGRPLPKTGALSATASVTTRDGIYALSGLDLSLQGEALEAKIDGAIADLATLGGVNLDIGARLRSLADVSTMLDRNFPETPPLTVSARFTAARGADGPGEVNAKLESEWLSAQIQGRIGELRGFEDVDSDVSLTVDSLKPIGLLFGTPLPDVGPVQASGHIRGSNPSYALTDLEAHIKDDTLSAQVRGSIADLLQAKGIDVHIDGQIGSLKQFSELAGRELPDIKPLEVRARFAAPQGPQGAVKVDATLNGEWLETDVEGTVVDLFKPEGIDANISVNATSLAPIGDLAGISLPDTGPVQVAGHILRQGTAYRLTDIKVKLADQDLTAEVNGSIADLVALKGIKIEFAGFTSSLARLSKFVAAELPDTGALDLQATVQAEEGIAAPAVLSAQIKGETISGSVQGSVSSLKTLDELDVTLAIEAARLDDLGKLAGMKLALAGPVNARAKLVTSSGRIRIDPVELAVGTSKVEGELEYTSENEDRESKAMIRGRLVSSYIDVNEILGLTSRTETEPELEPVAESNAAARKAEAAEAPTERIFSDAPLPLELLRRHDVDIALDIKRLHILHTNIDDFSWAIAVHQGRLRAKVTRARVGDRPIEAELNLDTRTEPASFVVNTVLEQVPLPPTSDLDAVLQGGKLLLKVDVAGQGVSMREIMGHLNGQAIIALRDSRTPNNALNRFGSGISISMINPFDENEQYTTLLCGASRFDIKDGIAQTPRGLAIQLPNVAWLGSGRVNLKTEEIDIRAQPRARRSVLSAGTLAHVLQLRGTLSNPQLVVDPTGLARTGGNIALAFSTGGMSLLYEGLYGLLRANVDRCNRIEEEIVNPPSNMEPLR